MLAVFRRRIRRPVVHGVMLAACAFAASASGEGAPSLVDELVKTGGFARADLEGMGDKPLARELAVPDRTTQAAFVGIIRIRSDGAALADTLAAPERAPLAKGTHGRGRFHDPPQPSDVAGIEFSAADLEVLADCKVAACKSKLGRAGIDALGAIDWSQPDAGDRFTKGFRNEALAYVEGYRKSGNASLIVYADKSKPTSLAATIESLMKQFTAFQRQAPGFSKYLTSYPAGRRPGMSDTIMWRIADFGYRPTLVIDHLVVDRQPEVAGATALVAAKTIYADHYLAGRIQMGAVVPITTDGVPKCAPSLAC